MKTSTSPKQKSPAAKARQVGSVRCADPAGASPVLASGISQPPARNGKARAGTSQRNVPTNRQKFRAWLHTELPTQLERDTMLTPEWIAECVVQEVECFLKAELPAGFANRLAARAYHLYPLNKHFHKGMNRPGNRGRENLLMFMRHWTAGWLKRAKSPLYKKLPWSFGNGQRLPA
jgi:hypothetical protein